MSDPDSDLRRNRTLTLNEQMKESYRRRSLLELNGAEAFVCYVDVDGFRQELNRDPEHLFNEYSQHLKYASPLWHGWIHSNGVEENIRDPTNLLIPYRFSDSWFFATTDASEESFRQICHVAAVLWIHTMQLKFYGPQEGSGLIGRGAIAKGRVWWKPSDQLILGQPLAHAYELAESIQCYGVAIHPSAAGQYEDAITLPLDVECKTSRGYEVRSTQFAKAARRPGWFPELRHLHPRLSELERIYSAMPDAKPQVIKRYQATHKILTAVIEEHANIAPGQSRYGP